MKTSLCLLLLSALLLVGLNAAEAKAKAADQRTVIPAATLAQLEAHTNIPYARYGERELQLDLYRPKERGVALPAIICIHGGGWFQGTRANIAPLAQGLAARGFVTATISYRLSGEKKFPAQIEDCKAAVRWLRAHAEEMGIDPNAIGVTGLSAGGHLAALLATSPA